MTHTAPLVSVCIPTYNRANDLTRAIRALGNSTHPNIEIIISDNASPDETQTICKALAASDSRIRYFRHPENVGPTKNFQFARQQANGKYFLWHGDDDYLDPDYIRTCVNELERDPSLVIAAGVGAYFSIAGKIDRYGNTIQCYSNSAWARVIKYLCCVEDNSMFYGVYLTQKVAGHSMPNVLAGDWAWMAQVLLSGKAKVIPSIFVHRAFGDSTSNSPKRIVSVIGAPSWHSIFPTIAISANVARHLVNQLDGSAFKRFFEAILIYAVIHIIFIARSLMLNFRIYGRKIPFARKIYQKYFKTLN